MEFEILISKLIYLGYNFKTKQIQDCVWFIYLWYWKLRVTIDRYVLCSTNWRCVISTYSYASCNTKYYGAYVSVGNFRGTVDSNYKWNFKECLLYTSSCALAFVCLLSTVWLIYSVPLTTICRMYNLLQHIYNIRDLMIHKNDIQCHVIYYF